MKFKTTLKQAEGMKATGIEVPEEVVEKLGKGKRPPVTITINRHAWRSTVAVMGGKFMVGVPAEHRTAAGIEAGEAITVTLELDDAPRDTPVPDDFAAALEKAKARAAFDALAPSHRKEHVRAIEEAKAPETRARRIEKAVAKVLGK